mgnify:CR=1 FL=1
MKLVKEFLYEKFKKESDPIHDMDIGPKDKFYRCIDCGSLFNEDGEYLKDEDLERANTIINAFNDREIATQCIDCFHKEQEDIRERNYYRRQQEENEWRQMTKDDERW